MLRVILFLATNAAILLVFSVVMNVLGVPAWLDAQGQINFTGLLIMAGLFGMGGSLISLFLSKPMAKMGARVQIIKQASSREEAWLLDTVAELAQKAGIGMPEVGIFPARQSNAFATGWNRNDALVAVSVGLLQNMRPNEVRAVLAHEIGHIANGDMVTLSLIQGVLNTFVMVLSRVIGVIVDKAVFKTENGHGPGFWVTWLIAELVLGVLASMIVMAFSRWREFRADAAGANLADRQSMIGALDALRREYGAPSELPDTMTAFGIRGELRKGLASLFRSHPPLEDRIRALQSLSA